MFTGAERAEQSEGFQLIPIEIELHAHAVHCGIDSGPEKAVRVAESGKKVGQFSTLCKLQVENSG